MDILFLHVLGCETRTAVHCDEKKIGKISESSLATTSICFNWVLFYLLMLENRLDCSWIPCHVSSSISIMSICSILSVISFISSISAVLDAARFLYLAQSSIHSYSTLPDRVSAFWFLIIKDNMSRQLRQSRKDIELIFD